MISNSVFGKLTQSWLKNSKIGPNLAQVEAKLGSSWPQVGLKLASEAALGLLLGASWLQNRFPSDFWSQVGRNLLIRKGAGGRGVAPVGGDFRGV